MGMAKLRAQPLEVPVPLPADGLPLLVTFDDITKPETVRRVDPENLVSVFGEGVRLKAVTLEVTDEAATEGVVVGVLEWLIEANFIIPPEKQPANLGDATAEQRLMPSDFIYWQTLRSIRR
jgi:hypothetical protein